MDLILNIFALVFTLIITASTYSANPLFGNRKTKAEKIKIYELYNKVKKSGDSIDRADELLIESIFQIITGYNSCYTKIAYILESQYRLYAIGNFKKINGAMIVNNKGNRVAFKIDAVHILFSELTLYVIFYGTFAYLTILCILQLIDLEIYYTILSKYSEVSIRFDHIDYILLIITVTGFIYSTMHMAIRIKVLLFIMSANPNDNQHIINQPLKSRKEVNSILWKGMKRLPRRILSRQTLNSLAITFIILILSLASLL